MPRSPTCSTRNPAKTLRSDTRSRRSYKTVCRTPSPAAAASLLGQLSRPRAAQNSVILRTFPGSSPTNSTDTWRAVDMPTLVIGHHDDPFHPYEIAQAHTDTIPGATLRTVPSKDADVTSLRPSTAPAVRSPTRMASQT